MAVFWGKQQQFMQSQCK